jgi:hypothetical protein
LLAKGLSGEIRPLTEWINEFRKQRSLVLYNICFKV